MTDNSDFIGSLFPVSNIEKKLDHICLLKIFVIYNFEELWVYLSMSDQVQLTCYSITKNQFDTSTHARDIEFSGILQSDWARTSWTKKSSP